MLYIYPIISWNITFMTGNDKWYILEHYTPSYSELTKREAIYSHILWPRMVWKYRPSYNSYNSRNTSIVQNNWGSRFLQGISFPQA